jgi:large subunit ribosomal protein L35
LLLPVSSRGLVMRVQSLAAASATAARGGGKVPKLKTKSGAKKRFKMTGTGKVKVQAQGKRHGMIKRTTKFVRSARGTMVLNDSDARIVKKYMPYHR